MAELCPSDYPGICDHMERCCDPGEDTETCDICGCQMCQHGICIAKDPDREDTDES